MVCEACNEATGIHRYVASSKVSGIGLHILNYLILGGDDLTVDLLGTLRLSLSVGG